MTVAYLPTTQAIHVDSLAWLTAAVEYLPATQAIHVVSLVL